MTSDYRAPAGLYPTRSWKRRAGRVTYKRFEVAAEAVRFLWRSFRLNSSWAPILRSRRKGSTAHQIRLLYEGRDHPLPRKLPLRGALDDKSKTDEPERKVAKDQEDISHLSKKYGMSCAEIRGLIDCFGTNSKKLDAAVKRLKQGR